MANILFIGAGMMASALTIPAAENRNAVCLAGSPLDAEIIAEIERTRYHKTLKRNLPAAIETCRADGIAARIGKADLILSGVSSFGVEWFKSEILPLIPETTPVLAVTKGMMQDGNEFISYPEYYERSTPKKISFNAIGGPCTSYELADHDVSTVTFCGRDIETLRTLKSYFQTEYYRISLSTDVRGVECAVALKNAYALAVSLAVGMSYKREGREVEHYNSQAALFGQAIREMTGLLALFGGDTCNIMLGAGDLYVTIFGGRTRKLGTLLGTGMPFDEAIDALSGITLESVVIARRTAEALRRFVAAGKARIEDYPLLCHVEELITGKSLVNVPWEKFESEFVKS